MSKRGRWGRWSAGIGCLLTSTLVIGCTPDPAPAPEVRFDRSASLPAVQLASAAGKAGSKAAGLPERPRWEGAGFPYVVGDLIVGELASDRGEPYGLRAIDGRSGKLRWMAELPMIGPNPSSLDSRPHPPVRVDGNRATVYVVAYSSTDGDSYSPYLVAIDATRGRVFWTTPVGGVLPDLAGDSSIMAQGLDAVLVSGGLWDEDGAGDTTFAFDPVTGKELWRQDGRLMSAGPSAVLVTTYDDEARQIVALNPSNGNQQWTEPVEEMANAATIGGTVLLSQPERPGSEPAMTLRNTSDGEVIERIDVEPATTCYTTASTYACDAGVDGLVGLNAETGEQLWSVPAERFDSDDPLAVTAVTDAFVYVDSATAGNGTIVDVRSGEVVRSGVRRMPTQFGNGYALGPPTNGLHTFGVYDTERRS